MNDEDHAKIVSNILGNKQYIGLTLPTRASLGEIYRRYSFPAISGKVERVRSNKCTDFASKLAEKVAAFKVGNGFDKDT